MNYEETVFIRASHGGNYHSNNVVEHDDEVFSRKHTGWFDDEEGDEGFW